MQGVHLSGSKLYQLPAGSFVTIMGRRMSEAFQVGGSFVKPTSTNSPFSWGRCCFPCPIPHCFALFFPFLAGQVSAQVAQSKLINQIGSMGLLQVVTKCIMGRYGKPYVILWSSAHLYYRSLSYCFESVGLDLFNGCPNIYKAPRCLDINFHIVLLSEAM